MKNLVKDFLSRKSFAVIGSFRDESKYAYKIMKDLLAKGYEVYPVNPHMSRVEGRVCYKNLSDIPVDIDVADVVTPPAVTEKIVEECLQKGIKRVWLQPGAESEKAIEFCKENNMKVLHSICVMLESQKQKDIIR
ncbi:MAG: CoA-binding protein [Candidatus Omnitrophica bacterium]|nr:CoA-binding protein [Candidatus Omnitrophota bacterium]